MFTNQPVHESSSSLRTVISAATTGLVERESLVEMVALSAVAEEHVLVIGPPGTAKSEAVRRIARATGGRYFEYLLGRFTGPSEIFGPVDLHKLKDGLVETDTLMLEKDGVRVRVIDLLTKDITAELMLEGANEVSTRLAQETLTIGDNLGRIVVVDLRRNCSIRNFRI